MALDIQESIEKSIANLKWREHTTKKYAPFLKTISLREISIRIQLQSHSKNLDADTGEITLHFPRSVVIYPEKNNAIPDHLKCRVIFQDNSEHIYKIPTVKIQTYSLKEIKEKHLTLFIPYSILRLRPLLKADCKHPLTQKELTEFVEEVIFVLKEELHDGYLTDQEYHDYVRLFQFAVDRVLRRHSQMREEVYRMTKPLLILPSMMLDELQSEIEERMAEIADQKAEIADQKAEIADQKAEIADQKAEIADQKALIADQKTQLADKDAEIMSKDAEIRRLRHLVNQLSAGDYIP